MASQRKPSRSSRPARAGTARRVGGSRVRDDARRAQVAAARRARGISMAARLRNEPRKSATAARSTLPRCPPPPRRNWLSMKVTGAWFSDWRSAQSRLGLLQ
eukprot:2983177-Pyramimonas_sp.AAC.1